MTIGSLVFGTIVSQILFVILKSFFMHSLNLENGFITALFFLALAIVAIATVRRMGILNYVESIFLTSVWVIITLITDYVITTRTVGLDIYTKWTYWLTFLVIILAVMVFHKKLHVQVRKANQ